MEDTNAVTLSRDDLHSFVEKYTQELAAERQARHEELVGFGKGLNKILTTLLDFGIGLAAETSKAHVAADVESQKAQDDLAATAEANRHEEEMYRLTTARQTGNAELHRTIEEMTDVLKARVDELVDSAISDLPRPGGYDPDTLTPIEEKLVELSADIGSLQAQMEEHEQFGND